MRASVPGYTTATAQIAGQVAPNTAPVLAPNGTFDVEAYRHAVDILITAQEIIVDNAGYPTEMIMKNSHDYRPLGLGYANLGALLMACGLPYDSDEGRDYAACVTAIMCGQAYLQSAIIAGSRRHRRSRTDDAHGLVRRAQRRWPPPSVQASAAGGGSARVSPQGV